MTMLTHQNESLASRAEMLSTVREFFRERKILEVDTPLLCQTPALDACIDAVKTTDGYLITSPELAMKKLLSQGSGDIYQLSHVFRSGEKGPWHKIEFTMIEYYRTLMPFTTFIAETCKLIELFLGPLPIKLTTYRELFIDFLSIDPLTTPLSTLQKLAKNLSLSDRDTTLSYLLTHYIEPHLGHNNLTIITDYPASQAALARTSKRDGQTVAKRFEIYHQGRELCNGYDELTDKNEYLKRDLPHSQDFADIIEDLPPCCGVAIGFDRLLALKLGHRSI